MGAVIFILIMVAVGAAALYAYRARQKRREALALFALHYGLEYAPVDPFNLDAYPFHLFTLGDGRGCENVVWGDWQGLPLKEADYWYYTETTDSQGHKSKSYKRFSVAIVDLQATLPEVRVGKTNLLASLAEHLGFHDIEFESEAFNREFDVRAKDRQFAYKLIDARMMAWLLSTEGAFGFEVSGPCLLTYSGARKPGQLIPLLGSAKMFHDHIPRLVWNEYGMTFEPAARPDPNERSAP
jgi:hypothetical protein